MKPNLKNFSIKVSVVGSAAALVAAIAFIIYGAVFNYFDIAVLICLLLGAAGLVGYTVWSHAIAEYLNLAAVFCLSFGLGLFFLNSYTVWADWWGNFDMYGSRGGIAPVILLIVVMLVAIVCGIISCFTSKVKEAA